MGFDFARWLRERMEEFGMTQKEFAILLGISESSLSRYLRGGSPGLDALIQVAEVMHFEILGVPMDSRGGGPSSDMELRNCLENYPGIVQEDIDEVMTLVKYKATKRLGRTSKKLQEEKKKR